MNVGTPMAHEENARVPAIEPEVFVTSLIEPRPQPMPELLSSGMPLGDSFVLQAPDGEASVLHEISSRPTDAHVFAYDFRVPTVRQPVERITLTGGYFDTESQMYVLPQHVGSGGTGCFVITTNDGTDRWDRWIDD